MSESPSGKREGFQDNATRKKKESLLLTQARPFAATITVVQGQKALSRSGYPNLSGMHKRLAAGLSGLVTCLQSNFIGTNFHGLFSSPFVSYWAHIDWLAPGYLIGAGNPTISRETKTQVPAACQPWQPHSLHLSFEKGRLGVQEGYKVYLKAMQETNCKGSPGDQPFQHLVLALKPNGDYCHLEDL